MDELLIKAKIELYRQLLRVSHEGSNLSDTEASLFALLASDVHVQMKLEGHFPNY